MMKKTTVRAHSVSGAFVFLLLGVFAVFSTLMVVLTAQMYRDTVSRTETHQEQRIAVQYLMNMVRGGDRADAISVEEHDGIPVLVISHPELSDDSIAEDDENEADYSDRWISSEEDENDQEETGNEETGIYQTLIYCWNGTLYELLTDQAYSFEPGDGEAICTLQAFQPELQGQLLQLKITEADGREQCVHVRLYASQAERANE